MKRKGRREAAFYCPRNARKIWTLVDTMPGNMITSTTISSMMITQGIEPSRMSELLIDAAARSERR